jgi:hypothetical protein
MPWDLRDLRETNQFVGPNCMCSILARRGKIVEAAIFMATSGRYAGFYVAQCAKGECGYFGELFHPW